MTWLKSDSGHKSTSDPLSRKGRAQVPSAPVQEELIGADGEPTMSVFGAMGVGENGQGIYGENTDLGFPAAMATELQRDFGWPTEKAWKLIRRQMYRDVEAV